jgi:phosphatidate cytidylyltransferase
MAATAATALPLAQAKEVGDTAPRAGAARPRAGGLKLRLASAFVLMPFAIAAVWFGGWALAALVVLAAAGMGWEWARLSGVASGLVRAAVIAAGPAAALLAAASAPLYALLLAAAVSVGVAALARDAAAPAPVWTAAGTLWLSIPCIALLWIAAGEAGRLLLLWLFAVVWASDAGAYAFGRALGGPRLAPRLSPNKTWSGALGGLACAGIIGLAAALIVGAAPVAVVALSFVLSGLAQGGDLAESLAKRRFGAKDSGALIPGHGGLLDRLDSLLTATAGLGALLLLGWGPNFAAHP